MLWVHLNVARPAMERRDKPGTNNLEAVGNGLNGDRLTAIVLSDAGQASLAADRTSKRFVPFVLHLKEMHSDRDAFQPQTGHCQFQTRPLGSKQASTVSPVGTDRDLGPIQEHGDRWPQVRFGSFSEVGARVREVRSTLKSRHRQAASACPKSAINGLPTATLPFPVRQFRASKWRTRSRQRGRRHLG
jgi:hypothetical protein